MTIIGNMINLARNGVSNIGNKTRAAVIAGGSALLVTAAHAQTAPTTLDGVAALGTGNVDKATVAAVAAAILGMGWVGYRLVRKYTGKA